MITQSGERAERTCDIVCQQCGEQLNVTRGDYIPRCPNCGNDTYNERASREEFGDESGGYDI